MSNAQSPRIYKIVVLGHAFVGKSALIMQFVHNFYYNCDPTIEDSFYKQHVVDNKFCLLDILDTSGEEHYEMLREQWMRTGEGFLLVYSITSRHSFEDARNFYHQICRVKKQDSFPVILVASKCDCEHERQIPTDEGHALARELGCHFFETSAKTGANVDEVFSDLVREIDHHEIDGHNNPKDQHPPSFLPSLTPTGGIISRIWKGWVGRHEDEPPNLRQETEAATHVKDEGTREELEKRVERTREEIERIRRDLDHRTEDFNVERRRQESKIMGMQNETQRYSREWTGDHNDDQETEALLRHEDETAADLREELSRKQGEIERMNRSLEHVATNFNAEKVRLESKITEIEIENQRYAEELEGLRKQLVQARKEIETLQTEHQRHATELLDEKEMKARQLEEEHKARELAEAQYQEHLHALQQQISRVETEKKWAEAEYEAAIMAEHERALTLEADLQRQAEEKEEEEKARLAEEERERARLQCTIGKARQQVKKAIAEQEQREREAAFATPGQAEARALILERQSQVLQLEKERYQRKILEEMVCVRRSLEEAHSKKEQQTRAHFEAEEARVRQLEEQQYLSLEKEQRRLSFLEDFAQEEVENNEATKDHHRRPRESEMLRQAREAVVATLEEERQQVRLREEAFKKQLEEEIARVCKIMEQELTEKERQAMEAQHVARLSRALALEAHEKARLVEEYKRKSGLGGEWVVLHRRVTEAEDYRRQLEHQQILSCTSTILENLHSLCIVTEVK